MTYGNSPVPTSLKDMEQWRRTGRTDLLKKARKLIESIQETPFEGIGKPEALRHQYTGYSSRRINAEHRLIYRVSENTLTILALKGHYE